ncbi:hypothetical protein BC835DRAFT_1410243 [Cytidiella melzeri]|nr:hypothetical protein BC835DRAFT_1410243 [Cytidiella melzeri]
MVGLFHRGNKGSPARPSRSIDTVRPHTPPPPYGPDSEEEPVYATATTTTTTHTVTTTTHTTHFFSLPLWRRRQQTHGPAGSPDAKSVPSEEFGVPRPLGSPHALLRNKELPPTPPTEEDTVNADSSREAVDLASPQRSSTDNISSSRNAVASSSRLPIVASSLSSSDSSQSATALARAALGLGLPPVMGSASTPRPSSDVNSVSFVTRSSPSHPSHAEDKKSVPITRRKTSLRKGAETTSRASHSEVEVTEHRRSRGSSLSALLTTSVLEEKGKGKQKETEVKSLSRKSSFWSRRRNDSRSLAPVNPPSPGAFLQLESLPTLQPLSPFRVDTLGNDSAAAGNGSLQLPQAANLRRRHSERTSSQSDISPPLPDRPHKPSSLIPGPRPRQPKRPSTADAPSSPRAVSSFFPSPASASSSSTGIATSSSQMSDLSPHQSSLRPRSQTNPPLLHRISLNLFGSSPSSAPSPMFPSIPPDSYTRSPSASFSSSRPSLSRQSVEIPKPRYHEEESPEIYLQRLTEAVSKAEVASVLASSSDEFHTKALRAYLARFDFNHDPLDVALRRLLMDVGLPRETQQIDRVMEAFAEWYHHCHPNLFNSEDHPYVLAFSLIMLHTDAFNKSNKRKMTKADYMKNTRLPGVAPEVLDCFYDNIVFAPFIFIEDPLDVNGQRGFMPDGLGSRRISTLNGSPGGHNTSTTTLLGKNSKIDPYYLITRNLLDELRVDIRPYVPVTSPYFYQGTAGAWQEDKLLRAFAMASVVEVPSEHKHLAPTWFGLNVGAGPGASALVSTPTFSAVPYEIVTLKVTKVGLLLRKDDILEGGRKATSRKWKEWSVLLTGSQLLFHRDASWAQSIQTRIDSTDEVVALSHTVMPRPDELYSVRDAVAVFDRSYTKHENTLRLVMPDGRHLLLQAKDSTEMNEWIACINYASAFKTAGVRMRSRGLSGKDIELTGRAAAASHLRELNRPQPSPRVHSYFGRPVDGMPNAQESQHTEGPRSPTGSTVDEPLTPPMENSARLLKATFDQVKVDLASGKEPSLDAVSVRSGHRPRAKSLDSIIQSPISQAAKSFDDTSAPRLSSRSQIIRRKVRDLDSRIAVQQAQLDSDMRFVRNISILTPFQRSTRDRLQVAIQNVAKRIMQVRLDLEKLTCHRDVLAQDLAAEERDWQRTKNIALRAATKTLETERNRNVPLMTLTASRDVEGDVTESPGLLQSTTRLRTPDVDSQRPQSTTASSYHSAMDFGPNSARSVPEDPQIDGSFSLDFSNGTSFSDGHAPTNDSPQLHVVSVHSSANTATPDANPQSAISHERFFTASEAPDEQAEDWNKTRAAKRVSLVRVPSTLKMFSPKHTRDLSQLLSEDSGTTITPDNLYRSRSIPVTCRHSVSDTASLSRFE